MKQNSGFPLAISGRADANICSYLARQFSPARDYWRYNGLSILPIVTSAERTNTLRSTKDEGIPTYPLAPQLSCQCGISRWIAYQISFKQFSQIMKIKPFGDQQRWWFAGAPLYFCLLASRIGMRRRSFVISFRWWSPPTDIYNFFNDPTPATAVRIMDSSYHRRKLLLSCLLKPNNTGQ